MPDSKSKYPVYESFTTPFGVSYTAQRQIEPTVDEKIKGLITRFTSLYETIKPLLDDANGDTVLYVRNILCQEYLETTSVTMSFKVDRLHTLSKIIQKLDRTTEEVRKAWSENEITRYIRMKATSDWQRKILQTDNHAIDLQKVDWKKVGFIHWVLAGQPNLKESKSVQRMLIKTASREYHIVSDDNSYYNNTIRYTLDMTPSSAFRKGEKIVVENPDMIFAEAMSNRSAAKHYYVQLGLRFYDNTISRPAYSEERNL